MQLLAPSLREEQREEPLSLWEMMEGKGVLGEVVGSGGAKTVGVSRPEYSGISRPGARAMLVIVEVVVEGVKVGKSYEAADASANLMIALATPRAMLLTGQSLAGGWGSW